MWKKTKAFYKSSPFSLHFCRCWGVLLNGTTSARHRRSFQ
jgi:hypothetical protein